MAAHQKKQWVFVTDDSLFDLQLEDLSNSLLAISFSSPCTNDSYEPINSNLAGSTVSATFEIFLLLLCFVAFSKKISN